MTPITVTIGNGYHEADDVDWSSGSAETNIHIKDSQAVTVTSPAAFKRRGWGVNVENSSVTLSAARG